jgi:hypothetical protein
MEQGDKNQNERADAKCRKRKLIARDADYEELYRIQFGAASTAAAVGAA